jgi:hypothetical protein
MVQPRERYITQKGREEMLTESMCRNSLEGNHFGSRAQRCRTLLNLMLGKLAYFIGPQMPNSVAWGSLDVN